MSYFDEFLTQLGVTNHDAVKYALLSYLVVIIIGIFLGAYKKIVIYNDFNDMGVCLLLFLIPVIVFITLPLFGIQVDKTINYIVAGLESILLIIVGINTFKGNSNILAALYSFIVKLPLALFFVLLVIDLFIPSYSKRRRSSNRGLTFLLLLIYSPILLALVKEKKGVFAPNFLINRARFHY